MPPLEDMAPIASAPAQRWLGKKKGDSSNLPITHKSKLDESRKVTFLSEESSNNNREGERREWNRHQEDDDDDDVSTLTDVFHGYDIEAQKRRQRDEEEEDEEERQELSLDNDDTSFDKVIGDAYLPSDDVTEPLPAYHQACEDLVFQFDEIVDTVRNCRRSSFARQNASNNTNKAPREETGFLASVWEQARRFLDPPTPPPIPTVLSSENTMEIYPDSSVSFAEGDALAAAPALNAPQENETDDFNPEKPGLSQRGLLDNVQERSSDYSPSDEAKMTRPSPVEQNGKAVKSTGIVDLSETSNASAGTAEADISRGSGRTRHPRSRCFVFVLIVLAISLLLGIAFGVAGKNQRSQRTQHEEKLEARSDPSWTTWPTASPSHSIKESSPIPAVPTTGALPQTASPSIAASEQPSTTPSLSSTTAPSASPSEKPSPKPSPKPTVPPTTSPSSSPTLAPTTAPTEVIKTSLPTTDPMESAKKLLPYYPDFRFVPWNNVTVSLQLMLQQLLGYTEATWNLPGTINNNGEDYSRFWEAQSFSTIQSTASVQVLSGVISMGFGKSQWDCWVNHFQNFTWGELASLSPVSVTLLEGNDSGNNFGVLVSDIQMAMATFGWTESNWYTVERLQYFFPTADQGLGARSPWDDLTVTEKTAATRLCYTRELWNRVPL